MTAKIPAAAKTDLKEIIDLTRITASLFVHVSTAVRGKSTPWKIQS